MYSYYAVYKPFDMLSQFTREAGHLSLADLGFAFPKDVYPVGRLDTDSEGLLLLTNDPRVNQRLLSPDMEHWRTYLVQVDGEIGDMPLKAISDGPVITVNGKKYKTRACEIRKIDEPDSLPERNPPVRFRKNIPTSWVEIRLKEGKNRQVRKMTAAAGFPTLRLIRKSIEDLVLEQMIPGVVIEMEKADFYTKLHLRS